jgi:hypothetical protein
LFLLQELGRGHIGRDHALLDEPMGVGALHWNDALDLAFRAEFDSCLGGIEIDGATPVSRTVAVALNTACSRSRCGNSFACFLRNASSPSISIDATCV